jgi:hypothetical protein
MGMSAPRAGLAPECAPRKFGGPKRARWLASALAPCKAGASKAREWVCVRSCGRRSGVLSILGCRPCELGHSHGRDLLPSAARARASATRGRLACRSRPSLEPIGKIFTSCPSRRPVSRAPERALAIGTARARCETPPRPRSKKAPPRASRQEILQDHPSGPFLGCLWVPWREFNRDCAFNIYGLKKSLCHPCAPSIVYQTVRPSPMTTQESFRSHGRISRS